MALGLNKIILASATANTAGAYLEPVTLSNVGVGNATAMLNAVTIPAGTYIVPATANLVVEINAYTGSANAWTTVMANGVGGMIISDGYNIRANSTGTTITTVTLWTVNGGQAATQSTYATS